MIIVSVYFSAGISVLSAIWVVCATFNFVATAFKVNIEKRIDN